MSKLTFAGEHVPATKLAVSSQLRGCFGTMATRSSLTSPKVDLDKGDLGDLHRSLYPARNSYKSLGLQIGVEIDEIVNIEGKHADHNDRLLEILSVRLKQIKPLTWNDIYTALRLDCVGESKTADDIRKKYGHLFGLDPSIGETSGKKHEKQKQHGKEKLKRKNKKGREKYSDREAREKSACKPKEIQTESESEDESSSTSTGEEETNAITSLESPPPKYKASATHTKPKHKTARAKNDKKKEKLSGKKKMPQEKSENQAVCSYPKKGKHSKNKVYKGAKQVLSEKTKASILLNWESVKTQRNTTEKQSEKKREKEKSAGKKAAAAENGSESSQEDSEDEDSGADDSSEDEEDRDSEDKSSNEEEPDDESFPTTSEEEVKEKPSPIMPLAVYEREEDAKEGTRKSEKKKVEVAVTFPLISRDDKQSDAKGKARNSEPKSKKRSRRRHRESSMSPTARGSSSSSTSPEDPEKPDGSVGQKYGSDPRQKKKRVGMKREKAAPSSSDTDDSSPECDMTNIQSESENKHLIKVFRCFFGKLCCTIKEPIETAAQLQAKHLLSRSTMENIITSVESQQVKAVALVRALDKKLKAHPERIFTVIEVLMKSKNLQEKGTEMWKEAGK